MNYDEGRRVVRLQKLLGFEMSRRVDVKTDIFITERLLATTTGVRHLLLVQENRSVKSVNFACRRFADNMPQGQFRTTEAIRAFYEKQQSPPCIWITTAPV